MSLKVGIVGLPNVGKSTLFNALLKRQQALVANYPFATIEPNVGIVEVPDERLQKLSDISKSAKIVPATVEFVDIAGLVAGASTGAGLGNKFLSHIREVDLIVQVLRDFTDSEIVKEGSVSPESDRQVINTELVLKDLETIQKVREGKEIRQKGLEKKKEVLDKLYGALNDGKTAIESLLGDEIEQIKDLCLLTAKRQMVVLNVSEDDPRLKQGFERDRLIISAKIESEISSLSVEDGALFLEQMGLSEPGLNRLIKKAYESLGLISFLTTGETESRAWTINRGDKAPQAAGVIHTDFEKKFIKAKVCSFSNFVDNGGWKNASDLGKVRMEGRDYVMQDGDVVEFMIGG